jgi:hypothetical protein
VHITLRRFDQTICFLPVDLNPCLKNEYFNIAWTANGQKQACEVMEKVVCRSSVYMHCICSHTFQFDKYQKSYKAKTARNPIPTAPAPVACSTSSSLIERATQERRACEQNTTNDMRAKLTAYLRENLLMIDYADSPERQAEVILKWWKVCHWQCSCSVNSTNFNLP